MSEIIILANSWKEGGRCIAGIDIAKEKWTRPIPSKTNHVVPLTKEIEDLNLLDIVEVPFSGKKPNRPDKYQIENEYVKTYNWKKVGQAKVSQIKKYCENKELILHTDNDRVAPSILDAKPHNKWNSLQLIETKVKFYADPRKSHRWRVRFKDGLGNTLNIQLTDPVANEQLVEGKDLNGKCILTVSLGQVWPPDGSLTPYCYKLVAGVIKL